MTAIEIWNLALLKIGVSKGITALDDASREAYTGELVYDHMLRAVLRHFPWSFATKYLQLTLVQGPAWTGATIQAWTSGQTYAVGSVVTDSGTTYYCILAHSTDHEPPNATYWSTTPPDDANGDWLYAYRHPTDCLFMRRLVPPGGPANIFGDSLVPPVVGQGRAFNESPIPFRRGRDSNGLLVYTNQQDAVLEYTTIDCDNLWADDLFIDALTWRLAAYAAPSLSRIDNMAKTCMAMYLATLNMASVVDAREAQPEKPGDAEWINAR